LRFQRRKNIFRICERVFGVPGYSEEEVITLTLEIPDDVAATVAASGRDLSRAALEAFAVEEYRARRLTDAQFRRLLGISRFKADEILKSHAVWLDPELDSEEV